MRTNADITVYNKYIDPSTRTAKYQRTVVYEVTWENRKAANVIASGLIAADSVAIFIPMARGSGSYKAPAAWQALSSKTGAWTLQVEDFIVRGVVTDEIGTGFSVSDLKAKYDSVVSIKSVDLMDQGSLAMRHWQVGAS